MPEIFFEDLVPGQVTTYGRHEVDRDDMVAFAREFDAQPFHVDEAAAKASAVGELIASGWYTSALQMRMHCDGLLNRAAGRGAPGVEELRWLRPVRAGDVLGVRQTVLDARPSRSRPGTGIVRLRLETLNGAGDPVLSQVHTGLFARRDATQDTDEAGYDGGPRHAPATSASPGHPVRGADARFFEDVEIGTVTPLGHYAFTAANIVDFARRFDPQPFHLSEAAAAASPFRRLAASGWHTAAAWMRCFVADREAVLARARTAGIEPRYGVSPGFRDLKWLRPVYAGDTIRFDTEALDKRISASRPGWGLVFSRSSGWNEAGKRVFAFSGSGFWGMREG